MGETTRRRECAVSHRSEVQSATRLGESPQEISESQLLRSSDTVEIACKMQSCHQSSNTKTEKQPSSLKACSRTADAKGRQYGNVSIDMNKVQDL